jgi:hypothetical protein
MSTMLRLKSLSEFGVRSKFGVRRLRCGLPPCFVHLPPGLLDGVEEIVGARYVKVQMTNKAAWFLLRLVPDSVTRATITCNDRLVEIESASEYDNLIGADIRVVDFRIAVEPWFKRGTSVYRTRLYLHRDMMCCAPGTIYWINTCPDMGSDLIDIAVTQPVSTGVPYGAIKLGLMNSSSRFTIQGRARKQQLGPYCVLDVLIQRK